MDQIALIDLDNTVADYQGAMQRELAKLAAPGEPDFDMGNPPEYIEARQWLIKQQPGFWQELAPLSLGFEIANELRTAGFTLHVLTKGPRATTGAWTEKVLWCQRHMPDVPVHISQDKSLVYGRVLFDDWPPYFMDWLRVRPRGLVICLAQPWNLDIDHPNVIRYTGHNLPEVRAAIKRAYERKHGEVPKIQTCSVFRLGDAKEDPERCLFCGKAPNEHRRDLSEV